MVWFRECWHEEVLRQLRQGLTKCYQVAFDHRGDGEIILCLFHIIEFDFVRHENVDLACSPFLLYQIETSQALSETKKIFCERKTRGLEWSLN